jgi:hypothetical protein
MMKQLLMVTTLAALFMVGAVYAQQPAGHTAPLPQPVTDATPSAPSGEMALGAVRISRRVKANGEMLAPGTYELRLTADPAKPDANGQTPQLERWVEFRQGNQVRAKEVVSIVPASDVSKVQKDAAPKAGSYKVEMLKGNEYVRVWINRGGNHYLIHLVPA